MIDKRMKRKLKILLITPATRRSLKGNSVTAIRWGLLLKEMGHKVVIKQHYNQESCDLMIALHAHRSYPAIGQFRTLNKDAPLVVVMTGTDLYDDIHTDGDAQKSLELADRLVVLQEKGVKELPEIYRDKARVIYQSAAAATGNIQKRKRTYDVCVIGHLRAVKDPFRAALASRQLPCTSRVRVLHIGDALDKGMEETARKEMARNHRYRWLGKQPHWKAIRVLGGS